MRKVFLSAVVFAGIFAVASGFRLQKRYLSEKLTLTFLDVGQGDSILVEFPKGKTLLVDGGGGTPHWTAARTVIPELRARGILDLDAVLITHPDSDHILGFKEIASTVPIKEYWINPVFTGHEIVPLLWQLSWIFDQNHVLPRYFSKAEKMDWQGVEMQLVPSHGEGENNQCLVLQLSYGGCRVLLTGDIEAEGEASVLNSFSSPHILKVAHHGSGTSTTREFIRKMAPDWSVVSVGWANRYRHPKNFVLERLRAVGSNVLRTDWHGFVGFTIQPDGKIQCNSARGNCGVSWCL